MSAPAEIKWIATATNGPGEGGIKEFWYTSENAPVDADEHQRVVDALAAMTARAEAAEVKLAAAQMAEQRMGDWLERELNSDAQEAQP